MKEILEPLARIPGVRTAVLVSTDGVPIAVRGENKRADGEVAESGEDTEALAGLAAGLLGEVSRAVAPLSWNAPRRVVLHATRGSVVMLHAPGAVLLVVLECGMRSEELDLPMEAAVARMLRVLRSMGNGSDDGGPASRRAQEALPGALPSNRSPQQETDEIHTKGNEVPELSGE